MAKTPIVENLPDHLQVRQVIPVSKTLDLAKARLSEDEELYVCNPGTTLGDENSNRVIYTKIIFDIPTGNGRSAAVELPDSWIPVDITQKIDKATLLASSEFRSILAKKRIIILEKSFAESLLGTAAAQGELERLDGNSGSRASKGDGDYFANLDAAQKGESFTPATAVTTRNVDGKPVVKAVEIAYDEADVRTEFTTMIGKKFGEQTQLAIISSHQNDLTLEECTYLLKHVRYQPAMEVIYSRLGSIAQQRSA